MIQDIVNRGLLISVVFLFAFWGLNVSTAFSKVKGNEKGSHLKDLEARFERLIKKSPYQYDPRGKPDPFKPFIQLNVGRKNIVKDKRKKKGVSRKPLRCETPVQCMDVGQLTLVGIVMKTNGNALAMAQDSAGIGYILKVGDRIGFNDGRVTEILPDRVIVKEEIEDVEGNLVSRNRVLLLHPEEE